MSGPVDPVDRLHHWYMVLMAEPEYQQRCEQIGQPAAHDEIVERRNILGVSAYA
jgi:hypothetical protein